MKTLSPAADRIGAALKALRRTHAPDGHGDDTLALGVKCLHVLIAELTEEGVPPADLQPLVDLEAFLLKLKARAQGEGGADRRKRRPPSQALLARVSALIDLLIKAGHDEGKAAQIVMRLLIAAGVPPPQQGGDARGWKRLLEWRTDLMHGIASAEAQGEYEDFAREIDSIPANERVHRVVDDQLWDRRRKPR